MEVLKDYIAKSSEEIDYWNMGGELMCSFDDLKGAKATDVPVSWRDIDMDKFEEDPHGFIKELFARRNTVAPFLTPTVWERQVLDALHLKYSQRRVQKSDLSKIPSLNDLWTYVVRNGQLVRFRCMIQDCLGSEFCTSVYSEKNPLTGEVTTGPTLLRDYSSIDAIDEGNVAQMLTEKELFLGVSPPFENSWVVQSSTKESVEMSPLKKARLDEPGSRDLINLPDCKLTVPSLFADLGAEKPVACVLKVYRNEDDYKELKTNDLIEVIGLLEMPPADEEDKAEHIPDEMSYSELQKIPVIHVFSCVGLADGNPKIPVFENRMFPLFSMYDYRVKECAMAFRDILSLALGGDRYASAYAMIALCTRVEFNKNDLMQSTPGKLILNISGVPRSSEVASTLKQVLEKLLSRLVYLNFCVEEVNKMKLVPRKNMATNQLEPSLLQLPIGTTLLIDETGLDEGKFDDTGTRNLIALRELLTTQKVKYDYVYQHPELEANFTTIILSDSPSILPHDVRIKINLDANMPKEERTARICQALGSADKTDMLRNYLSMQRFEPMPTSPFDPSDKAFMDDVADYLGQRNSLPMFKSKMNAAEFSAFITSLRVWDLLHGRPNITRDSFIFWKEVERIRDSRL